MHIEPWWVVAAVWFCAAVFFLGPWPHAVGWGVTLLVLVDLLLLVLFTVDLWRQRMWWLLGLTGLVFVGCGWLLSDRAGWVSS